jgi:hypothetical protein
LQPKVVLFARSLLHSQKSGAPDLESMRQL